MVWEWIVFGFCMVLGHGISSRLMALWLIKNNYVKSRETAARIASTVALAWPVWVPVVAGVLAYQCIERRATKDLPMPRRQVEALEREMGIGQPVPDTREVRGPSGLIYDTSVPWQARKLDRDTRAATVSSRNTEHLVGEYCERCLGSVVKVSSDPARFMHAPTLGEGAPCAEVTEPVYLTKVQRDRVLHGRIMRDTEERFRRVARDQARQTRLIAGVPGPDVGHTCGECDEDPNHIPPSWW